MTSRASCAVLVKRRTKDVPMPAYQSAGASGFDICALTDHPIFVWPGQREIIETGISLVLPEGTEAQVRPRSGLAAKKGITVLNTPGTIDADYRGEIMVILHNAGEEVFAVNKGDRIAQVVIAPVLQAMLLDTSEEQFNAFQTTRGAGGLGSTGVNGSAQPMVGAN